MTHKIVLFRKTKVKKNLAMGLKGAIHHRFWDDGLEEC